MDTIDEDTPGSRHLLAIPSRRRLERVLRYVLDEGEFLSPYGIRSLSKHHLDHPYVFRCGGQESRVEYVPGESNTNMFGGNSNWRGPIWLPVNYLLIEALERYHYFYGDSLKVECPTGSGRMMNLAEVAEELCSRLVKLFLLDGQNRRPFQGEARAAAPDTDGLLLFHEYFHGETGAGLALRTRLAGRPDRRLPLEDGPRPRAPAEGGLATPAHLGAASECRYSYTPSKAADIMPCPLTEAEEVR